VSGSGAETRRKEQMKTIFEGIWSIIGLMLITWFLCNFFTQLVAVPPSLNTPAHQKQSIDEFLNDHPDIKKEVDEMKRKAESDRKYNQS
jgi:hypothetical protein